MENDELKKREKLLDAIIEQNQKIGLYDGYSTWDEIFTEIEDSLHSPIPVRVKNWLRNKFETPIKK
jgi:hypothetical protein